MTNHFNIWKTHLAAVFLTGIVLMGMGGCDSSTATTTPGGPSSALPHFDHVVVVIEENHSYNAVIGASSAPYINTLAQQGALFTAMHGITHPSQPNYLALFAGSTFGLTSDDCPQSLNAPNLGAELIAQGMSFVGYSESMPSAGFTDCFANGDLYARKHNPWVNFADIPAASNQPFTSFPSDFTQLPTVAFVVPNQEDDMHSGSIDTADRWLKDNLESYATWAANNNSLLMVTWDEDDDTSANHIPLFFVGAHVKAGQYAETINHYNVLRTIEDMYHLSYTGQANDVATIGDVWQG